MNTTKQRAPKAPSKKTKTKTTAKNKKSIEVKAENRTISVDSPPLTKKQEIDHRRYLIATYRAKGLSNDRILELVNNEHKLKIKKTVFYSDIKEIDKQNVKLLEKTIKDFNLRQFWSSKVKEIHRERDLLWEIAENPGKNKGAGVSAIKQIAELRLEEQRIYEKLGIKIIDPEAIGVKDSFLVIGRPQSGDTVTFSEDGSVSYTS